MEDCHPGPALPAIPADRTRTSSAVISRERCGPGAIRYAPSCKAVAVARRAHAAYHLELRRAGYPGAAALPAGDGPPDQRAGGGAAARPEHPDPRRAGTDRGVRVGAERVPVLHGLAFGHRRGPAARRDGAGRAGPRRRGPRPRVGQAEGPARDRGCGAAQRERCHRRPGSPGSRDRRDRPGDPRHRPDRSRLLHDEPVRRRAGHDRPRRPRALRRRRAAPHQPGLPARRRQAPGSPHSRIKAGRTLTAPPPAPCRPR